LPVASSYCDETFQVSKRPRLDRVVLASPGRLIEVASLPPKGKKVRAVSASMTARTILN
jgi:hypothetical protein